MPNWYWNKLHIYGDREGLLDFVAKHNLDLNAGEDNYLGFEVLVPPPTNREEFTYEWCIQNWGTKSIGEFGEITLDLDPDDPELTISFYTAWCPPHLWLTKIIKNYPQFKIYIVGADEADDYSTTQTYLVEPGIFRCYEDGVKSILKF